MMREAKAITVRYGPISQRIGQESFRRASRPSEPGGALEAFLETKASGKTRFIGVTGHHDPAILTRAIREWPVDSVMMPIKKEREETIKKSS